MEVTLTGLVVVVAAGVAAPFLLGLAPGLRVPAIVLEILLGIVLGPHVLGVVQIDDAIAVTAVIGLAFLLFLAGLEVDVRSLLARGGATLGPAVAAFGASLVIALLAGLAAWAAGLTGSPLLVAVLVSTTGLGVIVPVMRDAGIAGTALGGRVVTAGAVAELGSILLLTLLFSAEGAGPGTRLALLGGFLAVLAVTAAAILGAERVPLVGATLLRLQDTTAQIRVRGAFLLVAASAALAAELGLEAVLGAFLAGMLLAALDRDRAMTHVHLREKLDVVGFGVFIPVFFVASGIRFDLPALTGSAAAMALVPAVLAAMLLARGLPALVHRAPCGTRGAFAAGLLQATTSVGFVVAGVEIGMAAGVVGDATGAALVSAALLSVLLFPPAALALLGRSPAPGLLEAGAQGGDQGVGGAPLLGRRP